MGSPDDSRRPVAQSPPTLSDNHHRVISITLSLLDDALGVFLRWAGGDGEGTRGRHTRPALYRETNTLTPAQRRLIVEEVAAMRNLLRELRNDLALKPSEHDAARDIAARCSLLWESLCELDAKHLRGYGEVPPELPPYLGPRVAELIRRLDRIASAARGEDEAANS